MYFNLSEVREISASFPNISARAEFSDICRRALGEAMYNSATERGMIIKNPRYCIDPRIIIETHRVIFIGELHNELVVVSAARDSESQSPETAFSLTHHENADERCCLRFLADVGRCFDDDGYLDLHKAVTNLEPISVRTIGEAPFVILK